MTKQMKAFLFMLSVSEGTHGKGDDGYNVIVGGGIWKNASAYNAVKFYQTAGGGTLSGTFKLYGVL